jgi:hydrogenase/urease accessory protein HupE
VLRWKRDGKGPGDELLGDSAAVWDTSFVVVYGGRLPAGARRLAFSAALFPEFGAQTICEISVYWRDSLIERRWLDVDGVLKLPVARDSLDARLARTREKPASSSGASLLARFIRLGYKHILPLGVDHILFVLGLFFFSTRMRPLLWQVTAFTLAHSITLAVALLGIFSLPGRVVEPLIALSIAVVGLENVFFRRVKASRWLVVFAFGLVHGMGFAGVLSGLGLPEGGFWPALIGFNLGVELGQLSVIAGAFALTFWCRNKSWYFKGVVVPVSLLISAVGLYWAVTRAMGG